MELHPAAFPAASRGDAVATQWRALLGSARGGSFGARRRGGVRLHEWLESAVKSLSGVAALSVALVAGCANDPAPGPGRAPARGADASLDAKPEAGLEAGLEASLDASPDASVDGGGGDAGSLREPHPSHRTDAGAPFESRIIGPVAAENALSGTAAWEFTKRANNHEVEGYASTTSAAAGEAITLYVSTSQPARVRWELYRLGYYAGLGGRFIAAHAAIDVVPQAPCPADPATGLVECAWTPTFSVGIDPAWVSGYYLFKVVRDDGYEAYVPLIVREAAPRAPLLVQSNVTTWQAYNLWGGASLYANALPSSVGFTGPRGYRVSFDRPYISPSMSGIGPGDLFDEQLMVRWLEKKGYDVAYATNLDVDGTPGLLDRRALFLDDWHDEYWSLGERAAVENARDEGVSLAFFGANTAYWRIRLEPSSRGAARRIITCYKDPVSDPHHGQPDVTNTWRSPPFARPENALTGSMYELVTRADGFPMLVTNASHWVYAGTGVVNGDTLSHIVGNEWDHLWVNHLTPPSLELLAHTDAFGLYGSDAPADMTVYYPTDSSFVFSAGTIEWARALGEAGYEDSRVARITENVLERAGLIPAERTVVEPRTLPTDVGNAATVTVVAGNGASGWNDGAAEVAEFAAPAGVAVDRTGDIYVTDVRNHRIRRITPDGTVSTIAGCGPPDVTTSFLFRDGTGDNACFSVPTGLAVGPDGNLYVSDSHNHRIRKVTPDGITTTFAGTGAQGFRDAASPLDARFAYPRGLAFGPDGGLYVADAYNSAIRRIAADGVTTIVQGGNELTGVAVAPDGTVYVVNDVSVFVVQRGSLVPIANVDGPPGDRAGPGATARLRPAEGILVDGNFLIVSDTQNYKVRRIALTPDHTVTTLIGDGRGGLEVGTGSTTRVVNPRGLALTPSGYLVADSGNNRILRVVR
jgi:sugar lactone lactonase YvrE